MTERSEQLRDAMTARLERVRGSLTNGEFDQLVADVVATAQRLEEIEQRERKSPNPPSGVLHTFKEPPEMRAQAPTC